MTKSVKIVFVGGSFDLINNVDKLFDNENNAFITVTNTSDDGKSLRHVIQRASLRSYTIISDILTPDGAANKALTVLYTNYRGETAIRRITPLGSVEFGSTPHHTEAQWLMRVWDLDKNEYRTYALRDIKFLTDAELEDYRQNKAKA